MPIIISDSKPLRKRLTDSGGVVTDNRDPFVERSSQ
jgi:hypothetical protein